MAHDPKHTPAPPSVPDDGDKPADLSDEEWAAIQEARSDLAAGRYYTHDEVVRWLRTWGTKDETDGPN